MNEEKTQPNQKEFISEREKILKQLYENALKDGIPIPEIGLEYITILIQKNPEILAFNCGNTQKQNFKPNTDIQKFESLELDLINAKQQLKELKIPLGSNGSIINGISITDYYETFNRIMREHKIVRHPRTSEYILTATDDIKLLPIRKEHLNYTPRLAYHQTINRKQIKGKFVILNNSKIEAKPYETQKLLTIKQIELKGELEFQNTQNFKLDYNNGIRKPAKRHSRGSFWLKLLAERDKAKMSLLNSWKFQQQHKRPKRPKRKLISQITITNITTN